MSAIVRRKESGPFDLMGDLREEINRVFERSLGGFGEKDFTMPLMPRIDVIDQKNQILVKADLPGMKKEDFKIRVEGGSLFLSGERKEEKETKKKNFYSSERLYGVFSRVLRLPAEVKAGQVKAAYKDGVLEVTLPKADGQNRKEIEIKVE
jgi:HSP20 family protein